MKKKRGGGGGEGLEVFGGEVEETKECGRRCEEGEGESERVFEEGWFEEKFLSSSTSSYTTLHLSILSISHLPDVVVPWHLSHHPPPQTPPVAL